MKVDLYKGDCLHVMQELIDKGVKVDAIICDPPFGITNCKWDSVIPFDKMWAKLKSLRNDNTPIVLFGLEPFSSNLRVSNINEFKYDWVWEKSKASNFLHAKRQPLKAHEIISVFCKKTCVYNPIMTKGSPYCKGVEQRDNIDVYGVMKGGNIILNKTGDRYPRSVQYFKTAESEGKFHPTQKPVALLEYLIKTYTNEGDTVLDFTMGSGSTGVACINTNRNFIGIELDDKYFDIAEKRINESKEINNESRQN